MINLTISLLICLTCTIIIETLISFLIGVRKIKDFANIFLVNCVTNPLVSTIPYYFNLFYGLNSRNIVLYTMEFCTIIFEGFIYKKYLIFKKINPYIFSLTLNLSSYLIGNIINYYIYK